MIAPDLNAQEQLGQLRTAIKLDRNAVLAAIAHAESLIAFAKLGFLSELGRRGVLVPSACNLPDKKTDEFSRAYFRCQRGLQRLEELKREAWGSSVLNRATPELVPATTPRSPRAQFRPDAQALAPGKSMGSQMSPTAAVGSHSQSALSTVSHHQVTTNPYQFKYAKFPPPGLPSPKTPTSPNARGGHVNVFSASQHQLNSPQSGRQDLTSRFASLGVTLHSPTSVRGRGQGTQRGRSQGTPYGRGTPSGGSRPYY